MRIKTLLIILILSLAVNASVLATVGYRYYRNFGFAAPANCPLNKDDRHIFQSLGLSDNQLAKISPLSKSFHARLDELGSSMQAKRNQFVELLGQDEIDHSRVESSRKEMAAIQSDIQKEVVAHLIQVKEILTPEQQKRFFALLRTSINNDPANPAFPIHGGNR